LPKSKFKVGDRIKVIAIPQSVLDMARSDKYRPHSTLNACKYLLRTNRIRTVVEIDREFGWPWIRFRYRERNGKLHSHLLMIEPECVRIVRSRHQRQSS